MRPEQPCTTTRTCVTGAHAVAVVLRQCAATGRAFWGWTGWDWVTACGPSGEAFRAAQPLPTETTVRPFVIALGYLLGGFTDFQHLGLAADSQ